MLCCVVFPAAGGNAQILLLGCHLLFPVRPTAQLCLSQVLVFPLLLEIWVAFGRTPSVHLSTWYVVIDTFSYAIWLL